ncbi:unnamed protein product [Eruca vesicaria subsp. sativa]|uniref:MADS-box domain-containing protein n=1 Tax=Eruca vesicaria subsp. sativa TaxID=29727 RepID=A0ABC8JVZ9_ERUVS|nr:unnamed protein product [Eruca vesicaria subsp. sativa]
MARPKFAWIEERKKKKTACQKRMKKAEELNILCNKSDCLVFFSRDDDKLVVWPTRHEAQSLVELFYALPENHRNMKTEDQDSSYKTNTKMIEKVIEELDMDHLIFQLQNGKMLIALSQTEIESLISYVSKKITGTEHPYTSVNDIPKATDVEPESPMGRGSQVYKMDKWFLDEDGDMETYEEEGSKSSGADVA